MTCLSHKFLCLWAAAVSTRFLPNVSALTLTTVALAALSTDQKCMDACQTDELCQFFTYDYSTTVCQHRKASGADATGS